MSKCDAILQNGVFSTIIINSERSFSENYIEWLKLATFEEIKSKMDAGIKLGFPIEGVPFDLRGEITQDDYTIWKQAIDQGKVRQLSITELESIIENQSDKNIVDAWLDCINLSNFGLLDYENESQSVDDGGFVVLFRYSPNSEYDLPPVINDFIAQNATCQNPPAVGSLVPYGGFSSIFTRERNAQGFFPEATYVLNTSKGVADGRIRAKGQPLTPKICGLALFKASGSAASWPSAEVEVPADYKLSGGGARVNWSGAGNHLTASYPFAYNRWRANGKDHSITSPASIDVWAIAIFDPEDEFEVVIDVANSDPRAHPQRALSARDGFQLVGGGARANWNISGQLLTASYPVGRDTWEVRSKDHSVAESNVVACYAIAMRPRNGSPSIPIEIREITTPATSHPEGGCSAPEGCRLIGGGARVNWSGHGNLLTASYPEGNAWLAKAKDHSVLDPASITIFAIGISEQYFA